MKTKRKKTSRMIRKLTAHERELLVRSLVIDTQMANTLYNLSQNEILNPVKVKAVKNLVKERDTQRELLRPLVERLLK